jgi:cytochrome P450
MEQRRLILPPFHGERMHGYEAIVEEETLREIESWPEARPLRTTGPMMRITLNIILRAVFGVREGWMMDEMRERTPRAVKLGSRLILGGPLLRDLGPGSPGRRFKELISRFEWGINALVDEARRDPELERRTDVLALFAQATHEDDGSLLSDQEIADQLKDVVAAGHETTANSLAWTVERLRRHPDVLRRLVEEADSDAGGGALREATIREVQRTRPVIPGTGRYTARPFELGDYVLPPWTVILLAAPLLHNDPEVYPNPDRFDPDRFLGKRPNPYAWIPFGGGIRRCPGAAFASMEMDIVLRTMLRHVELVPSTERDERWLFRGIAFAPASGGVAVVRRRRASLRPLSSDGKSELPAAA